MAEKTAEKKKQVPVETPAESIFAPLVDMRERMDELLSNVFHGRWMPSQREAVTRLEPFAESWPLARMRGDWIDTRFDVSESDGAVEITAELPGLDRDDIEIEVSDGILTVKGEKKDEEEEKGKDFYRRERRYGSFSRSFRLPESVDEDKASADLKKGVLQISLPKRPEAKAAKKKIEIKK